MRPSVCPYNESYWIYLALIYLPFYLPFFLLSHCSRVTWPVLSCLPHSICFIPWTWFDFDLTFPINQDIWLPAVVLKLWWQFLVSLYWMIWFIKQVECFYTIVVSGIMWYKHILHFYGFALDRPVPKPSSQGALRHARWHGWSDRSDATLGQRRDVWSLEPNQLSSDQHPDYLLYATIILPIIYTRFIISHFIRIPINQSVP